jgi:hypothetical protein
MDEEKHGKIFKASWPFGRDSNPDAPERES